MVDTTTDWRKSVDETIKALHSPVNPDIDIKGIMLGCHNDRLQQLYNKQKELAELQGTPVFDFSKPLGHNAKKLLTEWTGEFVKCIIHEAVELEDWLPWKHWSIQPGNKTDIEMWSEEHLKEIRMEIIDKLHFFLDLCILWGVTPDMMFKMYMEKHQINNERHNTGVY